MTINTKSPAFKAALKDELDRMSPEARAQALVKATLKLPVHAGGRKRP